MKIRLVNGITTFETSGSNIGGPVRLVIESWFASIFAGIGSAAGSAGSLQTTFKSPRMVMRSFFSGCSTKSVT